MILFSPPIREIACSVQSVQERPRLKWSTAAHTMLRCIETRVGSRAGSAPRGPRTHQTPLPLVQCSAAQRLGGLAGCYFEHCRSAEHSPRCRPDSTETWRGKPGPNWAALPKSSPHSSRRTWAMRKPCIRVKEKVGRAWQHTVSSQRRWDSGEWECGGKCLSGICISDKVLLGTLYWGHITISLTSTWAVSPAFFPAAHVAPLPS